MDSLELQTYEENLKIISLIKHIVYTCWEDIEVYNYTDDIEVDSSEDENEEDDYYNEDYIAGKKNKWW